MDDEDNHVYDEHANRNEDACHEEHEVPIVALGDAGTQEAAMMVEDLHAVFARRTVAGSLRPADVASITEASWMGVFLRNGKVFLVLLRMQLKESSSRDDARICARSEVHEEVHEEDAEEKNDGQRGIDAPVFAHHEDAEGNDDAQRAAVDVDHAWNVLAWASYAAVQVESVGRREDLVYFRHYNYSSSISNLQPNKCNPKNPTYEFTSFRFLSSNNQKRDLRPFSWDDSFLILI